MRRSIKIAAALMPVALVLAAAPELLKLPLPLAFGWIKSAGRFLSVMHLSSGTVTSLIILVGVLLVGTHAFCTWVRGARAGASNPWRWRWTCSVYAGLVLLLFASAALVGIAHQTGWMISSPEPIFKSRKMFLKERFRLRSVGNEILERARANEWEFAKVKSELIAPAAGSSWEEFAFYFVGDSNGVPDCVIVLPRNPKHQTEIGIVERANFHTRPFRDLPELLRSPP